MKVCVFSFEHNEKLDKTRVGIIEDKIKANEKREYQNPKAKKIPS